MTSVIDSGANVSILAIYGSAKGIKKCASYLMIYASHVAHLPLLVAANAIVFDAGGLVTASDAAYSGPVWRSAMNNNATSDSTDRNFSAEAKGILKAEMKRRGVTYAILVDLLSEYGVRESEANLRNKVSRGNFSASFFLQVLNALGTTVLHLESDQERLFSGRARAFSGTFRASRERFAATSGASLDAPAAGAESDPAEGER